jgi:hypothetical protein
MNIKGGVPHIVKKLKNSVANQVSQDWDCDLTAQEGDERQNQDENPSESSHSVNYFENFQKENDPSEKALFLEKIYRQRLSMLGMEMVVSVGVSYMIAWGLGYLFTLSSFSRIILGTLLAFAVNALAIYRIIKR